jgi:diguanylate cyclase (GGDEF)-like protein/PAS domain S-box-containing protein
MPKRIKVSTDKGSELKLAGSGNFIAQAVIDAFSPSVCILNKAGVILLVNQAWRNFYDKNCASPLSSHYFIGDNYFQVCNQSEGSDAKPLVAGALQVIQGEIDEFTMEYPCHSPTQKRWFNVRVTHFKNDNEHLMLSHENITDLKVAEEKFSLPTEVFNYAHEGIMITDPSGIIIDVNETFTHITGYSREESVGQNPRFLTSGRQSPDFYIDMWNEIIRNGYWIGEIWNRRKTGEVYAEIETISSVCDSEGKIQNFVALFSDITSIKNYQSQLERIAHYDALTQLPNRTLLSDRLAQTLLQCQRNKKSVAIVFLDLDGFKAVNDTHGHGVGDRLLITMSNRMKETLREGDTLARFGGDEFVAVLADLDKIQSCKPLLERLLLAASAPVFVDDLMLSVTASIGVTIFPEDNVNADLLLRHADQAMYIAKKMGKNRYHLFDVTQDIALKAHRESLEAVRIALTHHQFVVFYQPIVDMKLGKVIGVEALLRWQHPVRGLLLPVEIPVLIEDNPLSIELEEWVLNSVLAQIKEWRSIALDLHVSVNISALQLEQKTFVSRLAEIMSSHPDVDPNNLQLEVSETAAFNDLEQVTGVIQGSLDMGVQFALDHFGAGYSSLTYLRILPVTTLKIEQVFIAKMLTDPSDRATVEGVIGLSKAFRCKVIAQGVETSEQGKTLLEMGCHLAQGYAIAKPMPASHIPVWIKNWKPDARWSSLSESTR